MWILARVPGVARVNKITKKPVTSFHPGILCACPPSFPSLPFGPSPSSPSPSSPSTSPLPLPVDPFPSPPSRCLLPLPVAPPNLPLPTPLYAHPPHSLPRSQPLPSDHYLHLKKNTYTSVDMVQLLLSFCSFTHLR